MSYSYRFRRLPKFVQKELLDRDLRIAQATQEWLKQARIQRWRERKAEERRRREARERESAEFHRRVNLSCAQESIAAPLPPAPE